MAGTLALTNAAADIYVPASALIYAVIRHIHIANKDSVLRTFRLYLGATAASAAGTELFFDVPIAAGDYFDWTPVPGLKVTSTQFLTGLASANTALTILVLGEEYVVPK